MFRSQAEVIFRNLQHSEGTQRVMQLAGCKTLHNFNILIYYYFKTILCMYVYIGFKTFFYAVRHLDFIASYLPTGLHLGFFRSWPSLFLPSSFSSVFLVRSFVSASTSMLFWAVFLLPFFEHGHTM